MMELEYKCNNRGKQGHGGGSNSFHMHDPRVVFEALALKEGDCFLDLGCGPGDYSIEASRFVGNTGVVYALDRSELLINNLKRRVAEEGVVNLVARVADATRLLPIEDRCVDICLVSTVLHIPDVTRNTKALCNEICRVLKPDGRLAVIECHKEDMSFGPPQHMRLSPEDSEGLITRYG
ncbi:MAG: methyltransferase domain-containing protein, partial [Syntrophaceae bacterium]|nr:methyltransferase domain-containing protein [Syntrophaceae bacterium]